MAGTRIRRREEARVPIIIPVRREIEEKMLQKWQEALGRVIDSIRDLQGYGQRLRIPPTQRTLEGIREEVRSLQRTLEGMRISSIPVLGERFSDELHAINSHLEQAIEEAGNGRFGAAVRELERSESMIMHIGDVFGVEIAMLMAGEPEDMRVPGVANFNDVLGAVESALLDFGTPNEPRARNILLAARLYSSQDYYQIDNPLMRSERDALLGYIVKRGKDAKEGKEYTEADEDRALLKSFGKNIEGGIEDIREYNITLLENIWRNDVLYILAHEELTETQRKQLTDLRRDITKVLKNLRAKKDLSQEDWKALTKRYLALTGKSMPKSFTERLVALEKQAAELRGKASTVKENTAEWFGNMALLLIGERRLDLANLAIAMGQLERMAKGADQGARSYLSPERYFQIVDMIGGTVPVSPATRLQYAREIEVAALTADADNLIREYSARRVSKALENRRDRITLAAAAAKLVRLRDGDIEGTRRLLNMAHTYAIMLEENHWGTWTGSKDMEAALDAETLEGRNSLNLFNNALALYEFSKDAQNLRTAIRDWTGRKISKQRKFVDESIKMVGDLVENGKGEDAQKVLMFLVMYIEAVERLGIRGTKGQLYSIEDDDAKRVVGMERAIAAAGKGRPEFGGIETEKYFTRSFNHAMSEYVRREAERIEKFASTRKVGRDTINDALANAKSRVLRGDVVGAVTLLDYAWNFYGTKGWRYKLFTTKTARKLPDVGARLEKTLEKMGKRQKPAPKVPNGYRNGMYAMLEAIRMEIEGAHEAAKDRFDQGTWLIAATNDFVSHFNGVMGRFNGEVPWEAGKPDTKGQLPVGEEKGRKRYLRLYDIRRYEVLFDTDKALGAGPTLDSLLGSMYEAAQNGDRKSYERYGQQFEERFWFVAGRAYRKKSVTSKRIDVSEAERLVGKRGRYGEPDLRRTYGTTIPPEGKRRIDALEKRRQSLAAKIEGIEEREEEFPDMEYQRLMIDIGVEARIARTYNFVSRELELNEIFRKMVAASGAGMIENVVLNKLEECRKGLEVVRSLIVSGTPENIRKVEGAYRQAMYARKIALGYYSPEGVLTKREALKAQAEAGARGVSFPELDFYHKMHTDIFHTLMFGGDTKEKADIAYALFDATRSIEIAHFGIPVHSVANTVLEDYAPDIGRIRGLAKEAITSIRAGNIEHGKFLLGDIDNIFKTMEKRAETAGFWTNAALCTAAIAVSVIPGGGWVVGGAIFTTMAFENVVTQISVNGSATTEAWAMLGLAAGTMALGAAAGVAKAFGGVRAGTGFTTYSTRWLAAARTLNAANLGIGLGFAGYLGAEAYHAFSEGRSREGIFMAAMALFPLVHAGAPRLRSALKAHRAKAQARGWGWRGELKAAIDWFRPSAEEVQIRIEPNEAPGVRAAREQVGTTEGLFKFMTRYVRANAKARAKMIKDFPEAVQARIAELAEHAAVRSSVEAGKLSRFAEAALSRAIAEFGLPPEPPPGGGPRGTAEQIDIAGLLNPGKVVEFINELLAPDTAPEPALGRRAAQRARLSMIRDAYPNIGKIIDRYLTDPEYAYVRAALAPGRMTVKAQRALSNLEVLVRAEIDNVSPDTIAGEQAAHAIMMAQLKRVPGGGYEYIYVPRAGAEAPVGVARMPTVYGAEGGPPVVPVAAVRREGEAPPAEAPAPQEVVTRGLPERAYLAAKERVVRIKQRLTERGKRAESPDADRVHNEKREHLKDVLDSIEAPEDIESAVSEALWEAVRLGEEAAALRESGASEAKIREAEAAAQQARQNSVEIANNLHGAPRDVLQAFRDVWDMVRPKRGWREMRRRKMTAAERKAEAKREPVSKEEAERFMALLRRLYASRKFRRHLEREARLDPDIEAAVEGIKESVESLKETREEVAKDPEGYLDRLADREITAEEVNLLSQAMETAAARRLPAVKEVAAVVTEAAAAYEKAEAQHEFLKQQGRRRIAAVEDIAKEAARNVEQAEATVRDATAKYEYAKKQGVKGKQLRELNATRKAAQKELRRLKAEKTRADTVHRKIIAEDKGVVERSEADVAKAKGRYDKAVAEYRELVKRTGDIAANQPLARTERLFGELTVGDEAAWLLQHQGERRLTPEVVLEYDTVIGGRVKSSIEGIGGEAVAQDPVAAAVRDALLARIGKIGRILGKEEPVRSGDLTDILVDVLQNQKVQDAVKKNYNMVQQRVLYEVVRDLQRTEVPKEAVPHLKEAVERLVKEGVPKDIALLEAYRESNWSRLVDMDTPLSRLVEGMRKDPGIKEGCFALERIAERVGEIEGLTEAAIGRFGAEEYKTVSGVLKKGAFGIGRAVKFASTKMGGAQFVEGYKAARRASRPWKVLRHAHKGVFQLAVWWVMVYGGTRSGLGVYHYISDAEDIEEGLKRAKKDFGWDIREDYAKRIIDKEDALQDFYFHMPNTFPKGAERRPTSPEELQALLDGGGTYLEPSRINDWLADGVVMEKSLDDVNDLLAERDDKKKRKELEGALEELKLVANIDELNKIYLKVLTGSEEQKKEAAEKLTAMLTAVPLRMKEKAVKELLDRKLPKLTRVDIVEAMLASREKAALDIEDMSDLRVEDWKKRGIVLTFKEGAAMALLVDSGALKAEDLQKPGKHAYVQFLAKNTDVFAFLYDEMQKGYIPVSYIGDAVKALSEGERMRSVRAVVEAGKETLPAHLKDVLGARGIYLPTPIKSNSFFAALDERATENPKFKEEFSTMLGKYREDAEVMKTFNEFKLSEKGVGETVYGDVSDLAELIKQNPKTALEVAREKSMVGPGILVELDPSLRSERELVRFVVTHSVIRDGVPQDGVLLWVVNNSKNKRVIEGKLGALLKEIRPSTEPLPATAADEHIERLASGGRLSEFVKPPPKKAKEEAEEKPAEGEEKEALGWRILKKIAPVPGEVFEKKAVPKRTEREELVEKERKRRYPRKPWKGEEKTTVAPEMEEKAPGEHVLLKLGPEAKAFYDNPMRGQRLAASISETVDLMFKHIEKVEGAETGYGVLMKKAYGGDTKEARDKAKEEIMERLHQMIATMVANSGKKEEDIEEADKIVIDELRTMTIALDKGSATYSGSILKHKLPQYIFRYVKSEYGLSSLGG